MGLISHLAHYASQERHYALLFVTETETTLVIVMSVSRQSEVQHLSLVEGELLPW